MVVTSANVLKGGASLLRNLAATVPAPFGALDAANTMMDTDHKAAKTAKEVS
jgi:hypothetical protein